MSKQIYTGADIEILIAELRYNLDSRRRQKENQEDLLKKVNDETLRQLTKSKDENGPAGGGGRKVSEVVAYRNVKDIPATREMAIQVKCLKLQPKPVLEVRWTTHA